MDLAQKLRNKIFPKKKTKKKHNYKKQFHTKKKHVRLKKNHFGHILGPFCHTNPKTRITQFLAFKLLEHHAKIRKIICIVIKLKNLKSPSTKFFSKKYFNQCKKNEKSSNNDFAQNVNSQF